MILGRWYRAARLGLAYAALAAWAGAAAARAQDAVVFFSATGHTAAVAAGLSAALDAPAYRIEPRQPYTAADLNYRDEQCRANREMRDPQARPEMARDLPEAAAAARVFLGFPLWWGQAPRIVQTFLERDDLRGKTVVLFCTSGSSPIEPARAALQSRYPQLRIVGARRFDAVPAAAELAAWAARF